MLFFDHNNQLGQFQGYNNITHEYRINNIAKNGGGLFDGSINFMQGGASKFIVAPNGNIGIGTTNPSTLLEVSNALVPTLNVTTVASTTYGTNSFGPELVGRKARGTTAAPSAVQSGDLLALVGGKGYGATNFSGLTSGMAVTAAENWTDAAQGTQVVLQTIARTTTQPQPRLIVDPNGNVGVGTFGPASPLEVSNALTNGPAAQVTATTFTNAGSSLFVVSRARGTSGARSAVQAGDNLGGFLGRGFFTGATSGFSGTRGGMFVAASENWTDVAQGTNLFFNTTGSGTVTPSTKMTINGNGDVGIGTTNPGTALNIVRNGGETTFVGTSYNNGDGSAVFFQRARGTQQAPTAVLAGDALGYFAAGGYGATTFGDGVGAMAVFAAETWTDTANGTTVAFATTPLGTTDFVPQAAILSNGFFGLGTPGDANGIPTATDRLQVFGDVRVGIAGTNGCVKRFDGTGLIGTCSSDRRLKKNITAFAPALDKLTALQPVHYYWRAEDFPNRHFGNSQTYGLVAQDVEQVLPELVATDSDGYKAVDYSKLPLLTIQAMKELKAENDARKAENDALKQRVTELEPLKQRVAELERLLTEIAAATGRR